MYDNSLDELTTITGTTRIYYSFKYRLYMDDLVLADLDYDQWALKFSSGGSDGAKSGWISLNELIINNPDDDTWHEYHGWINTQVYSKLTSVVLHANLYTPASVNTKSYIDIDDLVMSTSYSGEVISHLGGSFEGLFNPLKTTNNYQEDYISEGLKIEHETNNYGLKLNSGQDVVCKLQWDCVTNVYRVYFDLKQTTGNLTLNIGGKNGENYQIEIGTNYLSDAANVYFSPTANGYKVCAYFIRTVNYPLYEVSIKNVNDEAIIIDNLFVGQIKKVALAGDYAKYLEQLTILKTAINNNINQYVSSVQPKLDKAEYLASLVTETSSQDAFDEVLEAYQNLLMGSALKSDLSELNRSLEYAREVISLRAKSEYETSTWLNFFDAYKKALEIDEFNSQEEVDLAKNTLISTIDNLKIKTKNNSQVLSLVVLTSGGILTLGTAVFLAIRKWRLW